jgi:Carboxypeptidase regulatory-like domain
MSGGVRRTGLLAFLLAVALAAPAWAQVSTGEINGKVTDTTGAVLPGVSVVLSGPALIQPQTVVTAESGGYRFPRIPIGTYTVSFELSGFKKAVHEGIVISAGFAADVNVKLELTTVQETVTVTGESPVVDTKSTTLASAFSREALEKIPSARDPWVILEQTPGVMMSGSNVGGNLSGQQTSFSAFGSSSNQQWNIDGAVISDIASGNSSPTYYDFDSFDEIQITTGGSDASQQGAGVQINFITKSGGNTLRGSTRFYDTNQKFENNNITTDQRDHGAAGGNPIQDIKDYGIEVGGPILKNRLWYWGAASKNNINDGVVNFFDTSSADCANVAANSTAKDSSGSYLFGIKQLWDCYKTDNTQLLNYNGKLQFQENAGNKSSFTAVDGIKTRNARGADAFHPLITTRKQDGPTILYRSEHQWIASSRLTLTAQYAHIHEDWGLFFQDPSLGTVQAISFVDTGFADRNTTSGNYHTIRPQDDIKADANYFLTSFLGGDHSIKFGFDYRRSPVESITSFGGGATVRIRAASNQNTCTVGGVTGICNEASITRDSDFSYIQYNRSLYFNDSYKKNRATINFGVRYDRQFDIARAASTPANVILPDLLPALQYNGADSGARYNNLSPRGGLTYDVRGNGKTVLKVNGGRYYGLGMYTASTLQPTTATTLRYAWRDLNADNIVQRNELDIAKGFLTAPSSNYNPANPSAAVTPATVDPNLKNDITDEFIGGIDHELMKNFGIGVSYVYRKYHQLLGTYRSDPADVVSSFSPVPFTANCLNTVNGSLTCNAPSYSGTYFQRSTPLHAATILRNNSNYNVYNGLELSARKRLANRWMMNGSVVYNRLRHYEPDPADWLSSTTNVITDPTNHLPIDQISGYETGTRNGPWIGKLSGMYQFPWGINGAANFNGHSSFPFNPTIVTGNRTGSLGTVSIFINPQNAQRYPAVYTLDVHADKTINLGQQRRLSLNFDLFNIANNNVILDQVVRQNATNANNINTLLAPRVARFGLKVNF